jgi:hypothetical protein
MRNAYNVSVGKPEGNLGVDVMILEWILGMWGGVGRRGLVFLGAEATRA